MGEHKPSFTLVGLLFVAIVITMTSALNFPDAHAKVDEAKPDIPYNTFCMSEENVGGFKACRINNVPSVGFWICSTKVQCQNTIGAEIQVFNQLHANGVNVVEVSLPQIDGVRCGDSESSGESCSGLLKEWVEDPETGRHENVGDYMINPDQVQQLIDKVKGYTANDQLPITAASLTEVKKFTEGDDPKKYRQICDIQGYFLVDGGFKVTTTATSIKEQMTTDEACASGKPTTQQVLDGLNLMIEAFDS